MAGKKGLSGRRKSEGTLIKEGLAIIEENYPDLVRALIHKAIVKLPVVCPDCGCEFTIPGGGHEASIHYAIDRILGKPKQAMDLKTDVEFSFNAEQLAEVRRQARLEEIKLLESVNEDIPD